MSTIVFTGQSYPDRNWIKSTHYKYHVDSELRSRIVKELETSIGDKIPEDTIVEIEIKISLKEYKKPNDTKDT